MDESRINEAVLEIKDADSGTEIAEHDFLVNKDEERNEIEDLKEEIQKMDEESIECQSQTSPNNKMQLVPHSWPIWYKSVNEQLQVELIATKAENRELKSSLVECHRDNGELLRCCEKLMGIIREKNEECESLKKNVVKIKAGEDETRYLGDSQSGLQEEKFSFEAQDDMKGETKISDDEECSSCGAAEEKKQEMSKYVIQENSYKKILKRSRKTEEQKRRMKQRIASLIREDKINKKNIEDLKRRCCKLGKMFMKVRRKNLDDKKKLRQCRIEKSVFECFHRNEKKVNEQLMLTVANFNESKNELRQQNEIVKAALKQTEEKLAQFKEFTLDLNKEKEELATKVETMTRDSVLIENHVDLLLVRIAEINEDKLKYARRNEKLKGKLEYAEEQVDLLNKYIDQEENKLKMRISEPRIKWWRRMVCFRD